MNIPDTLIDLQKAADAEYAKLTGLIGDERDAQWKRRVVRRRRRIQTAVTQHAQGTDTLRCQIEAAVKKVVRHPSAVG